MDVPTLMVMEFQTIKTDVLKKLDQKLFKDVLTRMEMVVADQDDACPDKAGTAAMNGCPDSDGDGVADNEDRCPETCW